jgi:hypothetical protein
VNDAEYTRQCERVKAVLDAWQETLGLSAWRINLDMHRESKPTDKPADSAYATILDVEADWRYMHANMNAYAPEVLGAADRLLEEQVIHELCHIFLCELSVNDDDGVHRAHEERVATMLARAFQWVRDRKPRVVPKKPVPRDRAERGLSNRVLEGGKAVAKEVSMAKKGTKKPFPGAAAPFKKGGKK